MSKPGVTIELDKPRVLRYGMNALVRIEELLKKPISKLDLDNISIKDMRIIIYAGLYHEDKDLTPQKVGELIDNYSDIESIAIKIGEAMTEAFGPKNEKRPMGKIGSGIGTSS